MEDKQRPRMPHLQNSSTPARADVDAVIGDPPARAPRRDEQPARPESTEVCTVARGRTVQGPAPGTVFVGYAGDEGRSIHRRRTKLYRPGEQIELSVSEAKRLKALGFLEDPERVITASAATRVGAIAPATSAPEPPAA